MTSRAKLFALDRIKHDSKPSLLDGMETREPTSNQTIAPNCLVIDDIKLTQEIAKTNLLKFNMKAIAASNGKEALEKLEEHKKTIQLIILDLNLPDIDGIELARKIKTQIFPNNSHVKIIGFTGSNIHDLELKDSDFDGWIQKGELFKDRLQKLYIDPKNLHK